MTLSPHADLSCVELAFFGPALLIAAYVCFRHGFNKQLGWFYILTLSLLRIIGSACLLTASTMSGLTSSTITGLETAYAVTNGVGTAPLLLALMGFLQRIHGGMHEGGLPLILYRPIHLGAIAGLILAIIGGTDAGSSSTSTQQTGQHLTEAASLIFLAIFIVLALITLYTWRHIRAVLPEERLLVKAACTSLPFLLVRLAYTVATAWTQSQLSAFYRFNPNVYVQAFMQFAMEAIVVVIYITAGLHTPKAQPIQRGESASEAYQSTRMEDVEAQKAYGGSHAARDGGRFEDRLNGGMVGRIGEVVAERVAARLERR